MYTYSIIGERLLIGVSMWECCFFKDWHPIRGEFGVDRMPSHSVFQRKVLEDHVQRSLELFPISELAHWSFIS